MSEYKYFVQYGSAPGQLAKTPQEAMKLASAKLGGSIFKGSKRRASIFIETGEFEQDDCFHVLNETGTRSVGIYKAGE